MRRIDEIIIHCSATVAGRDYTVADIDAWHRQRGLKCIGYHYVITIDGTVETGRKPEEQGAHCTGHNAHSIGVCYIGGLDEDGKAADTRTAAQKQALIGLLVQLKREFPDAVICGHREFAAKDCPCFDAGAEYAGI